MSTTFNETRDQIITNALTLLGVAAAGEAIQPNDLTFCASLLNSMVKAWMAQGIHLWTEEEGTIYFTTNTGQYNLFATDSVGTSANGSDGSGTPVETTLSANASGNTLLVVNSTGMSIGDNIGIVINSSTLQWTTITNIVSNTITLNTVLSSTAPLGNNVYTYTTNIVRPLSITSARVRDSNSFDRPIKMVPRNDYVMIPQKNIQGTPTICFYSPQLTQGQIFLWPTPTDVSTRLKVSYLREIADFNTGTDNADFPQEWLEAIIYNLAVRAAPAYGVNLTSAGITGNPDILRMANQFLEELKAWDAEQPYIKLLPGWNTYRP